MVEFAIVAPILLFVLLLLLDFGRGLFYYSEMAAGARESARQGTLEVNENSNLVPGAAALPGVNDVVPQLARLAAFGYALAPYATSGSTSSAPSYGTYSGSIQLADGTWGPGRITLAPSAARNQLYIFVYELDPATGATRWDSGAAPVRTGGHRLVVVDLKMKWAPAVLGFSGLAPTLTFDAQSTQREEW
jgi:Flp pilus assembly protein TadG